MNLFIAALIALFFVNKTTKDIEEKTNLASWRKTFVFLLLSFVVGVFYYKTYQVATVKNVISIGGFRQGYDSDSTWNVKDTALILISRNFNTASMIDRESNPLMHEVENYEGYSGGVFVRIVADKNQFIKDRPNTPKYINFKIPKDTLGQVYTITMIHTGIPKLIPVYPIKEDSSSISTDSLCEEIRVKDFRKIDSNIIPSSISMVNIKNGSLDEVHINKRLNYEGIYYVGDKAVNKSTKDLDFSWIDYTGNTMNFFTAADISQYIQDIFIDSSCPIKFLKYSSDVPIELQYNPEIYTSSGGFVLTDKYIEKNKDMDMSFVVKLPSMANLQLIRSLILTTLLTALLSFFFSNFYYCIRKLIIDFKEKNKNKIPEVRIKKIRKILNLIYLLIVLFVLYLIWITLFDSPIHLAYSTFKVLSIVIYWLTVLLIIALIFTIFVLYVKTYWIKGCKKNK